MLRYLQATRFNYQLTWQAIMEHAKFVQEEKPTELVSEIGRQMLNNGWLYIHKRDKCFRPVVVLNVQKMILFSAE